MDLLDNNPVCDLLIIIEKTPQVDQAFGALGKALILQRVRSGNPFRAWRYRSIERLVEWSSKVDASKGVCNESLDVLGNSEPVSSSWRLGGHIDSSGECITQSQ